jgi:malate dehydrogenase
MIYFSSYFSDYYFLTNLNIISNVAENVKKYASDAFVIVVSNPLDAIVYAFYKVSGLPKNRVVGMAGALDNARFRTFIAMETGLSVQDVSCIVMGGHGPTMVPITRTATVGGVPLTDILSQKEIDAIVKRVQEAGTELVKLYGKGSAFFSPAAAIMEMAEGFLKDKKRVIPSAALCEGEYGINGYFIGVPVVIGAGGVEKILELELSVEEQDKMNSIIQQSSHLQGIDMVNWILRFFGVKVKVQGLVGLAVDTAIDSIKDFFIGTFDMLKGGILGFTNFLV